MARASGSLDTLWREPLKDPRVGERETEAALSFNSLRLGPGDGVTDDAISDMTKAERAV